METRKEFSSAASWNSAAVAGLMMAAVTLALQFASTLAGGIGGIGGGFLSIVMWVAKIVCCAVFFKYLLKRFATSYNGVGYDSLKNYGLKTGLFSSLIIASILAFMVTKVPAAEFMEAFQEQMSQMPAGLDSNTMDSVEKIFPKLPLWSFFFYLAYGCFWGWIFTLMFAKDTLPHDAFGDPLDHDDVDDQTTLL